MFSIAAPGALAFDSPPVLSPTNASKNVGDIHTLTVSTQGGVPPILYQWQFEFGLLSNNWQNLGDGTWPSRDAHITGADTDTLTINVQSQSLHQARYRVMVSDSSSAITTSNAAGLSVTNFLNGVPLAPKLTYVGESLTLTQEVLGGTKPYMVSWYRNGSGTPLLIQEGNISQEIFVLDLGPAEIAHTGSYRTTVIDSTMPSHQTDISLPVDVQVVEPPEHACPQFFSPFQMGRPDAPELKEISGMVASRVWNGALLWVHNDSGDTARVFAMRQDGELIGTINLSGATNVDWEDMAMGPGPQAEHDYLYIGDIGDNLRQREKITLYRIPEPDVTPLDTGVVDTVPAEAFSLVYPEAPEVVYDAETLLVDPWSGAVYVVTKQADGENTVYIFMADALNAAGDTVLEAAGSLTLSSGQFPQFSKVTGGDVSSLGDEVLLRQYGGVIFWHRLAGEELSDVFLKPPCPITVRLENQGEAIAFGPGGSFFTTSERPASGALQPLLLYGRVTPEGEGEAEGTIEGEGGGDGEGDDPVAFHSGDSNQNGAMDLLELLRIIQLYNASEYHCQQGTEDSYAPGAGDQTCTRHSADYRESTWHLDLSELLRSVQLFSFGDYTRCSGQSEDGFCLTI